MRRTSSWCSIFLHPGQNGGWSKIIEKSKIGISRHLDSSTTTQKVIIMVQYWRSSRSSWAKSVWSSIGRTVIGKAIWERSQNTDGRRFPIENAYSYTVQKDYSYLCMWMTSNWPERNKTLIRCGKYSTKKLIWKNKHLSQIMYTWDVLNDNVK